MPVVASLSSETAVAPALSAGVTDAVRRDDPEAAALLDATVERIVAERRERVADDDDTVTPEGRVRGGGDTGDTGGDPGDAGGDAGDAVAADDD